MLTYTFSTREKVLLALLAFVAVGVVWYRLVFSNIQEQVATIDGQIASAQDELVMYQAQAAAAASMRASVEDYEAQGVQPVALPAFDNTQNLMAYLNGVLAGTNGYTLSFDNPTLDEDDGTVHRLASITFGAGTYAEARSVTQSIARGPYPCQIDALGIVDNTNRGSGSSSGTAAYTVNAQVTFFERAPKDGEGLADGDDGVQGQDLSQMSRWNE